MKITTITAAFAAAGAVGFVGAPLAAADEHVSAHEIGERAELVNGDVVQGWTISELRPSTDAIPYAVRGTLWEVTATDEAIRGNVIPIVSNLNARADNGEIYRALFQVATPLGVNPATLAQGEQTSGKVYFDVTGAQPDAVVYAEGENDLLVWEQPDPESVSAGAQSTASPSDSGTASQPATEATPAEPAEDAPGTDDAEDAEDTEAPAEDAEAAEDTEGVEGAEGTEGTEPGAAEGAAAPAGSQGTPLPAGSQGTPLPEGSQGTPLPEGSQPAPVPHGQGSAVPAGSQGTPLPDGSQDAPVPHGPQPAPASTP